MILNVEDYWDLLKNVTYKYSRRSKEPVEDRIEFSIACEAFLQACLSFIPSEGDQTERFRIWLVTCVKWRIYDYNREGYRRKRKPLTRQSLLNDIEDPKVDDHVMMEVMEEIDLLPDRCREEIHRKLGKEVKDDCCAETKRKYYNSAIRLLKDRMK